ncbi:MAG: hypothetical protein E6I93_17805 [Chloroflexi bacterium]|nr:MAG: hypothetical protein E6I93_17805 [Chloroflexota bacterium]
MRQLYTWPRSMLTLPLAIRLLIVIGTIVFSLIFYMLSFPVIHNGNVLAISVILVAWIFRKKGLLIFLGVAYVTLVVYQWVRQRLLWHVPFTLSFISGFILLAIIGYIVVSLRTLLDSADEARMKAQEAECQTAIAFEQQRQLNDLKNQFILNVNHELRSPLTVISGYLSLLLEKYEQFDRASQTLIKNCCTSRTFPLSPLLAKQSSISRNLGTRANVHISIFLMALPFEQMHNASVISCVTCSLMPTSIRQEILLLL